jgi:hypothetical protein
MIHSFDDYMRSHKRPSSDPGAAGQLIAATASGRNQPNDDAHHHAARRSTSISNSETL